MNSGNPFYKRSWFVLLMLALVFAIGISIGTREDEPVKKVIPSKIIPSPSTSSPEPNPIEVLVQLSWNEQTEEDRKLICYVYMTNPQETLDEIVNGVTKDREEKRKAFKNLLDKECVPHT